MHPDDLLELLKLPANPRKAKYLDLIHAVCEELSARDNGDFSVATVSRLVQERGGPATATIQSRAGLSFQALIKAWGLHAGGLTGKGRQVADDPRGDVLDKIPDPQVRADMEAVLAENQQLRTELAALEANGARERPDATVPTRPSLDASQERATLTALLSRAEHPDFPAGEAGYRRTRQEAGMEPDSSLRCASLSDDPPRAASDQSSATDLYFTGIPPKGFCPVGRRLCHVGRDCTPDRADPKTYGPVPGYPTEHDCVSCRFFLSGPAWLPGLIIYFNTLSTAIHERAKHHDDLQEKISHLVIRRNRCGRAGQRFAERRLLEQLSRAYEVANEALSKRVSDLQATHVLIARVLGILPEAATAGMQLVAVGTLQDIHLAVNEARSAPHPLERLGRQATFYPARAAPKPEQRGRLFDCLLVYSRAPPRFLRLDEAQERAVSHALNIYHHARAGATSEATLDYSEVARRLRDRDNIRSAGDLPTKQEAGIPAREVFAAARGRCARPAPTGDHDAP